jgi:hypothetical protein
MIDMDSFSSTIRLQNSNICTPKQNELPGISLAHFKKEYKYLCCQEKNTCRSLYKRQIRTKQLEAELAVVFLRAEEAGSLRKYEKMVQCVREYQRGN